LPVHCALLAMVVLAWLAINEEGQTLQLALAKVIGIIGCIALRRAWLGMDRAGQADERP
jgi:multisubunit Na+/H+ antiporter MnhE subunit